ncbi:hypothetical protein JOE68_001840 [Saccharothrix algeriensis]|uniref:Uncharacterized protein n=1 Tax=Saccharothrix algeriensis TaxID=173560 RepID=A0ABS2S4U3_9PSEU|nr:hypothetical protein [Saccharothrix algeriensis]
MTCQASETSWAQAPTRAPRYVAGAASVRSRPGSCACSLSPVSSWACCRSGRAAGAAEGAVHPIQPPQPNASPTVGTRSSPRARELFDGTARRVSSRPHHRRFGLAGVVRGGDPTGPEFPVNRDVLGRATEATPADNRWMHPPTGTELPGAHGRRAGRTTLLNRPEPVIAPQAVPVEQVRSGRPGHSGGGAVASRPGVTSPAPNRVPPRSGCSSGGQRLRYRRVAPPPGGRQQGFLLRNGLCPQPTAAPGSDRRTAPPLLKPTAGLPFPHDHEILPLPPRKKVYT